MAKREIAPVSTGTMRDFLIKQMIKVANGEQDHPTALSITRYAQQVYNICNLELRAASLAKKRGGGSGGPAMLSIQSLDYKG